MVFEDTFEDIDNREQFKIIVYSSKTVKKDRYFILGHPFDPDIVNEIMFTKNKIVN